MISRTCWLVVAFVAGIGAGHAEAGVRRVWAVNDGEKVERDAQNHPASARNATWDGRTVRVFGARNEIIAFQVIVDADERGVRELSLRLPSLISSRDRITYQPPAADPTDSVGRPIQIFAATYMLVTTPSHASWVFRRGSPAAPPDPTGWKPVQLVPENARAGMGGLPVSIRPNENQAIWIEVYVDRARTAGHLQRDDRGPRGRRAAAGPDRARGLRLHPAGREQHARDAVLLERSARALPRPQPRRRVPPVRPPPPRRTGSRVRRGEAAGRVGPFLGRRLHSRSQVRGAGDGRRQCRRPSNVLRTRIGLRRSGERLGEERRLDDVARARSCRGRSRSSTCRTSRARTRIRAS